MRLVMLVPAAAARQLPCRSSTRRAPSRCARPRRRVRSPSPSARCICTTSTQRPNFMPAAFSSPTWRKPSERCRPIEPTFSESPITAIIWRKPRASAAREQRRHQRLAHALAADVVADIDGILGGEAVGGAFAELREIAVAEDHARPRPPPPARRSRAACTAAMRAAISASVGRVFLEGAGAVQDVVGIDGGDGREIGRASRRARLQRHAGSPARRSATRSASARARGRAPAPATSESPTGAPPTARPGWSPPAARTARRSPSRPCVRSRTAVLLGLGRAQQRRRRRARSDRPAPRRRPAAPAAAPARRGGRRARRPPWPGPSPSPRRSAPSRRGRIVGSVASIQGPRLAQASSAWAQRKAS